MVNELCKRIYFKRYSIAPLLGRPFRLVTKIASETRLHSYT